MSSLISQDMWYFFALGIVALCPLSLTLQLIGLCGAPRWGDNSYILTTMYCKVKQWIQRNKSYNQIKMCMCVENMGYSGWWKW